MNTVYIRGVELPAKVRGVTVLDENDDFNVYINTVLSPEVQKKAAQHELRHIRKNHFYNSDPVIVNELEASGG